MIDKKVTRFLSIFYMNNFLGAYRVARCVDVGKKSAILRSKRIGSIFIIMLRVIFSIMFLLLPVTAYAEDAPWDHPPHPDGWYGYDDALPDLLNIKGLSYHEARPIIMSAGWEPLQTLQVGTEEFKQGIIFSSDGLKFWGRGYHELQTCTGSGMAYCAFLFQNKNGDRLRIVTKYEEHPESSFFAKVLGYRFNP